MTRARQFRFGATSILMEVDSAAEMGWSELQNGELLNRAETAGYEALITTDQQLRYQQKSGGRPIAHFFVRREYAHPAVRKAAELEVA